MSSTPESVLRAAIAAALAVIALAPGLAAAQATTPDYWASPNGVVIRSGTGLCWHTTTWSPASSAENCDPSLAKVVAPAPVMVAAAPPPAAVVPAVVPAPAPVPVATRKITLNAEELFDFDKSVLKPAGKKSLEQLTNDLAGVSYTEIAVTGHTDRLGKPGYNQKLSERRADSVMKQLVANGVPANRITASGMGERQPVTKDCKGAISNKLKACLQPDRRVEVSVTGTQQVAGR
jgi:OOP family OmpA-OmpF porin